MADQPKEKKVLEGAMHYQIIIENDDLSTRYEDNNENRLLAYQIVQKSCEDYLEIQKKPHAAHLNLSKQEMKELQITQAFLRKHLVSLGEHILKKYKNTVPEKDKPKIEIVKDLNAIKEINAKARRKG